MAVTITTGMCGGELYPMNNQERKQARIARDKARKAEKRKAVIEQCGTFENVITCQNLHRSLRKRRKNVAWKGSVQVYLAHAIVKIKRTKDDLLKGELNVNQSIKSMTIHERGKKRYIHAIMIDSRVIQGALCDSAITPLTQPTLIYDNPASTKGKGVTHARNRVLRHLRRQIKETGPGSYALLYDFSGFFDSISHRLCREKLRSVGMDERLTDLTMYFIKMYQQQDISLVEDPVVRQRMMYELENDLACGATLGSQISQDMALVIPNKLDHRIKDGEAVKGYMRYMDDGLATDGEKKRLHELQEKAIEPTCDELELRLNRKKTHIVKFTKGFVFLKIRYIVTETGKIIKNLVRSSVVRMRRRLHKFRKLVDLCKMKLDDVFNSFSSWFGNAKKYADSYWARKAMLVLYNRLFNRYRTGGLVA